MITRRKFIKQASITGSGIILSPLFSSRLFGKPSAQYFAVHEFIENNPDAVFIMKTGVDVKTNASAIKQVGLDFANSVFINTEDETKGIPLDFTYAIKPNLTGWRWTAGDSPFEQNMGIITDVNFVEGVIESMKSRGINSNDIHLREVNGTENLGEGGYSAMADRTGADVQVIGTRVDNLSDDQVCWMDVPDGIFFKKIPYLAPVNSADSWLLNISKFKAHSMGLTLCAKNMQGTIAARYQQHCASFKSNMSVADENISENVWATIEENYNRHVADGIPRWNTPGWDINGGLGMETWASRCTDNHTVTKPNLHVIEGVYGRDGDFYWGPHDGIGMDFMTNIIIFSKNAFHADIVGHWLGAHEPGNFGLFHIAKERGLSKYLNPMDIPVYEWNPDATATLTPLADFERTELRTKYMRQDGEADFTLINEPYNYPTAIAGHPNPSRPESFVLQQNYPNPFNPSTTIQYNLAKSANVRIEIFNTRGRLVDILVDKYLTAGSHMVVWNAGNQPSGTYFYRMRTNFFTETKKLVLMR